MERDRREREETETREGKKGRDGGGGESRGCISCTVEGWKGVREGRVCAFLLRKVE